jgi:hypothetical protein
MSKNTVYGIAWDFLVSLEAARCREPSSLLLFIAHSLSVHLPRLLVLALIAQHQRQVVPCSSVRQHALYPALFPLALILVDKWWRVDLYLADALKLRNSKIRMDKDRRARILCAKAFGSRLKVGPNAKVATEGSSKKTKWIKSFSVTRNSNGSLCLCVLCCLRTSNVLPLMLTGDLRFPSPQKVG